MNDKDLLKIVLIMLKSIRRGAGLGTDKIDNAIYIIESYLSENRD